MGGFTYGGRKGKSRGGKGKKNGENGERLRKRFLHRDRRGRTGQVKRRIYAWGREGKKRGRSRKGKGEFTIRFLLGEATTAETE